MPLPLLAPLLAAGLSAAIGTATTVGITVSERKKRERAARASEKRFLEAQGTARQGDQTAAMAIARSAPGVSPGLAQRNATEAFINSAPRAASAAAAGAAQAGSGGSGGPSLAPIIAGGIGAIGAGIAQGISSSSSGLNSSGIAAKNSANTAFLAQQQAGSPPPVLPGPTAAPAQQQPVASGPSNLGGLGAAPNGQLLTDEAAPTPNGQLLNDEAGQTDFASLIMGQNQQDSLSAQAGNTLDRFAQNQQQQRMASLSEAARVQSEQTTAQNDTVRAQAEMLNAQTERIRAEREAQAAAQPPQASVTPQGAQAQPTPAQPAQSPQRGAQARQSLMQQTESAIQVRSVGRDQLEAAGMTAADVPGVLVLPPRAEIEAASSPETKGALLRRVIMENPGFSDQEISEALSASGGN